MRSQSLLSGFLVENKCMFQVYPLDALDGSGLLYHFLYYLYKIRYKYILLYYFIFIGFYLLNFFALCIKNYFKMLKLRLAVGSKLKTLT